MIRFYNGLTLSMKENMEITDDEVWVDGTDIVYVGKHFNQKADTEINLEGNLLMPSFKNAHTHSAMTFARSFSDDLPLQNWLFDKIFPLEAKLTEQDIYNLSKLAFLEYLESGISACFDMYYFPKGIVDASIDMGFKTVLCGAVNDFKESVPKLEEYYNLYNNCHELISYQLGFHAEYTTSCSILEEIAALAEKYKAPVFTHSSETEKETQDCIKKYGKSPTALFSDLGLFNYGGGSFHSVWVTDEDLEIYKEKNVYAIINAASNAKLASGIAPVSKMLNSNIHIAIGTDGPASNNALDMFREMHLICATQKLNDNDASSTDANAVLHAATFGSAHCMGLTDCDVIDVGKKADLIVIDMNRPNMQPINNITKNIVYSGSKTNIKLTMINGKILYKDYKFIDIDCKTIYKNAQAVIDRIK